MAGSNNWLIRYALHEPPFVVFRRGHGVVVCSCVYTYGIRVRVRV